MTSTEDSTAPRNAPSQDPPPEIPPFPRARATAAGRASASASPLLWPPQHVTAMNDMYLPCPIHPAIAAIKGFPVVDMGDESGSQSEGESGSPGSSNMRDDGTKSQDAAGTRLFGEARTEGQTSHHNAAAQNNSTTSESSYSGRRKRRRRKHPVSTPGRVIVRGPMTNLNSRTASQDAAGTRLFGEALTEGQTSQLNAAAQNNITTS